MTLTETNRIDIVAQAPTGEIVLMAVATGDWSSADELRQLRAKLDAYVAFIGSQQYEAQFGRKPAKIVLSAASDLTSQATAIVREVSASSGVQIDVEVEPVPPGFLVGGAANRPQVRRKRFRDRLHI